PPPESWQPRPATWPRSASRGPTTPTCCPPPGPTSSSPPSIKSTWPHYRPGGWPQNADDPTARPGCAAVLLPTGGVSALWLSFCYIPESEHRSCCGLWLVLVRGMPGVLDYGNGRIEAAGHFFLYLGRPNVILFTEDDKNWDRRGCEFIDAIGL